jgi:hypothetical protein
MWRLDKIYSPNEIEKINKTLAERVHADKGSWILTKVLRVPRTVNYKYPSKPRGRMLWEEKATYTPAEIMGREIPEKVQELLEAPEVPVGKRSDVLWMMEHELAKAGFKIDEIHSIVKDSKWNKYKGRKDEEERLMHEIALAMKDYKTTLPPVELLRVTSHADIMSNPSLTPGWLIEEFWTRNSHGIIAGEPKSYKSTLTLDLAISIASGKPFLGRYAVWQQGPVLIVQNENAEWIIKDRVAAIAIHRGLGGSITKEGKNYIIDFPLDLPIYYINNQGFSLSNKNHRDVLEEYIKQIQPIFVVFDPLYLMFDGDVNSVKDLNPVLSWLLWLKNTYNLNLVIVHHWRKSKGATTRGGQRMLGSTTLHGWTESAWYVESGDEVILEREFRAAQSPPKLHLKIDMGELGESTYNISIKDPNAEKSISITQFLELQPESTLKAVSEGIGVHKRKAQRLLENLIKIEKVICFEGKYSLKANP